MFLDKFFHKKPTGDKLIDLLVDANKLDNAGFTFNRGRAVAGMRDVRGTLSQMYGITDSGLAEVMSAGMAVHTETLRATAQEEYKLQNATWGAAVEPTILAGMRLAEDTLQLEGDVFATVVAPIELGMDSRVWVTGSDSEMVKDLNYLLNAWDVVSTINAAWQDMETYSAFYVSHKWRRDGVPEPIHWSPKRVAVGPDTGFGPYQFTWLSPRRPSGDVKQTEMEFARVETGKEWNEWADEMAGKPIPYNNLTWLHFMKPKHKMYPYPWLAKAATPVYTRQVIEEMRVALVEGLINQLWVMTVEDPQPKEIAKLASVINANRAERLGFLLWRAGLEVKVYAPESIEQLLLPDAWWAATLDIFRRIGRSIRIVSGESATRSGQGSTDAEIDTRVAQNKAMAHRSIVAKKVVLDLVRQWPEGGEEVKKALADGKLSVHMTPVQLFLGEDLEKIWTPMWTNGMASIRTIHAGIGLDTEYEAEAMKAEQAAGLDEVFVARQQFAQRVADGEGGSVTKSSEPGRPGKPLERAKASVGEVQDRLEEAYDDIDSEEKVRAFIILMAAVIRAHMREAYVAGYAAVHGNRAPSEEGMRMAWEWEQEYIRGYEVDLLAAVETGLSGEKYRIKQHAQSVWRHGYMSGVFQAKAEDGWTRWQRVLRPSKSGPCEVCREDARRWHPITEPFWDHPYGVCSAQIVKFMRSGTDGWEAYDRQMIDVPRWEEA